MNDDLVKFGNPINRLNESNIDIQIVYGGAHHRDKLEAENFSKFSNVILSPIKDYPFHTSLLIYTKKGEKLKQALTRKIDSKSKDDQFFRPENNEQLILELLNKIEFYNYDLNDILLK
ncbi:hypothetical protein [Acinetobacter thermotolerans]|uniref:hypothetical protein n=1 Tax=Acinetobacter thermotolerans TaxID=3151487 RepID=UPI00325A901F